MLAAWVLTAAAGILPAFIPTNHSALRRLDRLALHLNGTPGLGGEPVSRALVLLPRDRARPGLITFELDHGARKGVYQCEALGRGLTAKEPRAGWIASHIGAQAIYYAPGNESGGATLPGIYDARLIEPAGYEIELLNPPGELRDEADTIARVSSPEPGPRPYFSAVWKHWYSRTNAAAPIDLVWSEAYQPLSAGAAFPVYENRPTPTSEASRARQARQLAHNPRYYFGPFGRSGFANHVDRWDDADHQPGPAQDPANAGRAEIDDFRFRDTSGCLKIRPDCQIYLNAFVAEQAALGRRVQYDVRETSLLDQVASGPR
jgi:hypothetical protein